MGGTLVNSIRTTLVCIQLLVLCGHQPPTPPPPPNRFPYPLPCTYTLLCIRLSMHGCGGVFVCVYVCFRGCLCVEMGAQRSRIYPLESRIYLAAYTRVCRAKLHIPPAYTSICGLFGAAYTRVYAAFSRIYPFWTITKSSKMAQMGELGGSYQLFCTLSIH